jgi:hypothetical protein
MYILDPDFFHPGSRDQKGTGSLIRNTAFMCKRQEHILQGIKTMAVFQTRTTKRTQNGPDAAFALIRHPFYW